MKKGIITVFIILGILVLALLIWGAVFNNGGLNTALNAICTPINDIYKAMTGSENNLIDIGQSDADEDGNGNLTANDIAEANEIAFNGD